MVYIFPLLAILIFTCSTDKNNENEPSTPTSSQSSNPVCRTPTNENMSSSSAHSNSSSSQMITHLNPLLCDSKNYAVVKIGSQIWFAENMNEKPAKGNKWCYGPFNEYCTQYGGLYDWEAANNVCPSGWRLPSRNDFDILYDLASENSGIDFRTSSVFNILLGGKKILDGYEQDSWQGREEYAYWWASSDGGSATNAQCFFFNGIEFLFCTDKKRNGFSVRCIKN